MNIYGSSSNEFFVSFASVLIPAVTTGLSGAPKENLLVWIPRSCMPLQYCFTVYRCTCGVQANTFITAVCFTMLDHLQLLDLHTVCLLSGSIHLISNAFHDHTVSLSLSLLPCLSLSASLWTAVHRFFSLDRQVWSNPTNNQFLFGDFNIYIGVAHHNYIHLLFFGSFSFASKKSVNRPLVR